MISDYHFTGRSTKGNLVNVTVHIDPKEVQEDKDLDLIIRRIVADALKVSTAPEIHINVVGLDLDKDKVNYEIVEEKNHPIHQVAFKHFEKNKAIKEILKKRILPLDVAKEEVGEFSLLERFAKSPKHTHGFFGRIKLILSVFYSAISYPFYLMQMLWHALTNQSAKQLKWDINLLAEICGTPPTDMMSMKHSLKYMSTMLDREQEEVSDPDLQLRFKNGLKLAEQIDQVRHSFSKSKALSLVKEIQKAITYTGPKKMLVPIGYKKGEKLVEALLEISKDPNGKYQVVLISAQQETRNYFDRQEGLPVGSQSLRREITDVEPNDLLAAIPTLIELQTSPHCQKQENGDWQMVFLQSLKFHDSTVQVGATTEPFRGEAAPGHLGEAISYVKGEKGTDVDEANRFDLALRLRLFLEVCQANKKGLKDPTFWISVRTTARHLANQIEQEKGILGSQTAQGIELTRVYSELQQLLETLDKSPPKLTNLAEQALPLASGPVELITYPTTPFLSPIKVDSKSYPKVDPPFKEFDASRPIEQIKEWGLRCRRMIEQGGFKEAAMEAKLMSKMLFKQKTVVNENESEAVLAALNNIGEAIARGVASTGESTNDDLMTLTDLNIAAFKIVKSYNKVPAPLLENFVWTSNALIQELTESGYNTLPGKTINPNRSADLSTLSPAILQPMLNLAKFIESVLKGENFALLMRSNEPVNFALQGDCSGADNFDETHQVPLPLRAPEYAHDLTHEISNRYVTEFCCLGCIRDNCPAYNQVPKEQHRFHPLYMLHNYVDIFCDRLTKGGQLHRDEITDLMYTQQTNQNANHLWSNVHGDQHGFDIAKGFDANDRQIQAMNTLMVYLENPHFFSHPDLRWQFELKVLKYGAFASLMGNVPQTKPFLISMLNKLTKEIAVQMAAGDQATAAYLLLISGKIKTLINSSAKLPQEDKDTFSNLLYKTPVETVELWAKELVTKHDDHSVRTQMMVLPIFLEFNLNRFINDSNNGYFDSEENLQLMLGAIMRLEAQEKLKKLIDPERRELYLQLRSFLLNKAREKVAKEPVQGHFVNGILKNVYPKVAELKLQWDPVDFPTFMALGAKGGLYKFDLSTGKLVQNAKQADLPGELPMNLLSHPGAIKLFGKTLKDSWTVRGTPPDSLDKMVAYTHEKYPNFRIVVRQALVDAANKVSRVCIERRIPAFYGKTEWITYQEFDSQGSVRREEDFSDRPELPIRVAMAIGDRTCWVDRAKKTIHVFDVDSNRPYAIIKVRNWNQMSEVDDLKFVATDLHLLRPSDQELVQYSAIEDPTFIQVLGKKNRAQEVSYHRYELAASGAPLAYEISKKGVFSKAMPGYKLAPNGVRPGSADPAIGATPLPATFDGFQLLQKDGDEKVLIPLRGFEQLYSVSGAPLPQSKMIFSTKYGKCPLYEFSMDRETNRLVAKGGDGYGYLAYLSMAHWDYASAAYYLSKARTSGGYDKRYDQVFEWVSQWHDDSPNGIAMKLHVELFREKVLHDRQIQQIKEGRLMAPDEIERTGRLVQIADLYAKYRENLTSTIPGETGVDPSLALTIEESGEVKKLIKTLLAAHGKDKVETHEPMPVRAEQTPLQQFKDSDQSNELGITAGTLSLWSFNGTNRDKASFVMKDPRWVTKNFRDLFNQILAAEKGSIADKQLQLQIRSISELSTSSLNAVEKEGVKTAQSYLLKLISLRETDPQLFLDFKDSLQPDNKLEKFDGPFFTSSRLNGVARLNALLGKDGLDRFALRDAEVARTRSGKIRDAIYQAKVQGAKNPDPHNLLPLVIKVVQFSENWKPTQGSFADFLKKFLLEELFGFAGAKSIESLNSLLKALDPVDIEQPRQAMIPPPPSVPKQEITYAEKYQPLIAEKQVSSENQIAELEKKIAAAAIPQATKMVETDASKVHAVIGDQQAERYSHYFTKELIPPPGVDQTPFDELSSSSEKAFSRVAEKHRTDLNAYLSSKTVVATTKGNGKKLKAELLKEKEQIAKAEKALKRDLLQYVELFDTPAGILAMRRLVGKGVKPSLDFLIALWRRGETSKVWEMHPLRKMGMREIPEGMIKKLDADIAKYMELATTHSHLNRVIEMADSYLGSCGKRDDSTGDAQLANELFEGVQTKRNYSLDRRDNSDYRDLLYVEYSLKIIMYADQIQTLREMSFDPNAVRQLRMGRGKTEVIMPILAKRKATGKNLVVLMLPEELYEANCRGLDIKNRLLFGQEMHRFDFSRKTDKSPEALRNIHLRLLKTIQEKGFVMSTKRSLLSMKNSYVLLLNKLTKMRPGEDNAELLAQVREMSKIVSLFYNNGDVLADEVDACLDVRKEVNFALGENLKIDKVKGDVGAELMQLLMAQPPESPSYGLKEALIQNTQAAIAPENRRQMLKELVRVYYDQHLAELSVVDKESFVNYVMNDQKGAGVEGWVFKQKEFNNELFKKICSLKAFMGRGYGTTFGRIGNVNYGRDPLSGLFTIPYKSSNTPSLNSEFDDDIERISFTYQDYLQNGVTYSQVFGILSRMQKQALAELRNRESDEPLSIGETATAKELAAFVQEMDPDKKLGVKMTLTSIYDPKAIEALVKVINENPKGRLAFCHKVVVSGMKQYASQINSMSTEAPQLVRSFGGFTGTPWNIHTYHDKIYAKPNLGVDGQTWALMLGRQVEIKSFAFDAAKPIDSLLSTIDIVGNCQAVIDTGAYLRGTSNAQFIEKAMAIAKEKELPVKAGIYFDESGKIVKKPAGEGEPLPIEIAPVTDLMSNITLYDQAHTVGADIKQGKKAKAVVTIGENTFIRDLFQAVWRLRQLHQEQTVVLAVSDKVKERILGGEKRELTIEDIHKFCLMNEAMREADDNFRAEKEKIQGYGKRALLPEIASVVNQQASDDTIIRMAQKFATNEAHLFIKVRQREEAYDDYGKISASEAPADTFARLKVMEEARSEKIANDFKMMLLAQPAREFTKIEQRINGRLDQPEDWFPNNVESHQGGGGEVEAEAEQEVQAEAEAEQEIELNVELEVQTEVVKEVFIPIVQTGAAGHGDVNTLSPAIIEQLVSQNSCPIDTFRELNKAISHFDKEIVCSAVFERNLSDKPASPQSVFYSARKPVKQVLIAKNEKGEWKMLISTIHEAHGACRDYIKSTKSKVVEVAISAGRPLIMYKTGDERSDALPFTDQADKEMFYSLYVQAKLFNGEIEFGAKEEQEALKKWLKAKPSLAVFKEYFENNILGAKPRRYAEAYAKSSLYEIFNELLQEAVAV